MHVLLLGVSDVVGSACSHSVFMYIPTNLESGFCNALDVWSRYIVRHYKSLYTLFLYRASVSVQIATT